MAGRFWGLTRRQTVIAFSVAIAVGIAIALVMGGNGASDDPSPTAPKVEQVRAGTKGARDAVWVFGFHTLRFTPDLHRPQQVDVTAFGSVQGGNGRVHMYDPGTGRVGVLDSSRNTLTNLGRLPNGVAQADTFAPVIAGHGSDLWLVSRPGELTRFDAATRRADAPLPVVDDADPTRTPSATGVVAAPGFVVAVTRDASGFALARIDPASRSIVASNHVVQPPSANLDGLAADGTRVWIVAGGSAIDVDATTLTVDRTVAIRGQGAGSVRGAVVAAGALWVLADNGGSLSRLDPATGRLDRGVAILPVPPGRFRTPASLVSDGSRVWAMVQRPRPPADHSVRLVGFDARRGTRTVGIDLPSALFAGAAAAS